MACCNAAAVTRVFAATHRSVVDVVVCDSRSRQRPAPRPNALRAMRVSIQDSMMYLERSDNTGAMYAAAIAAAADTSPQATDGVRGPAEASTVLAADSTTAWGGMSIPSPAGDPQIATSAVTPAAVPRDKIITFNAGWPYSALGRVNINGATCSATQIGDYTIVSAAHCIYDRETKEFSTSNISFEPATYRDTRGNRRYPQGNRALSYYTYMNGWITETTDSTAYWYPSVTQRVGTYRYGSCNIVNDGNGEDSSLVMQGSGMTCDVMEPGESGSGLWIRVNDQYYVRGVESHGLIREGQAELDVGCEFDTINYNFVLRNKDNKPRA
ncbi:hypothetical protein COO60DRAFT_1694999 [Scenedesmus sp. NREL 46B-D3]|nr:hypothetical protein COO60DRAFT_1694999 [Scenedesmus sp. NREL 46B-D3]